MKPRSFTKRLKALDKFYDQASVFYPEAAKTMMRPSDLLEATMTGDYKSI